MGSTAFHDFNGQGLCRRCGVDESALDSRRPCFDNTAIEYAALNVSASLRAVEAAEEAVVKPLAEDFLSLTPEERMMIRELRRAKGTDRSRLSPINHAMAAMRYQFEHNPDHSARFIPHDD